MKIVKRLFAEVQAVKDLILAVSYLFKRRDCSCGKRLWQPIPKEKFSQCSHAVTLPE